MKKYAASAENYEKAIKYGAKTSNLHYNLAYTYDKLGKEKKAIIEYEKVSPLTKEVLSILAGFYLKEKKYTTAIKYYKKIVDMEPKKAASYAGLGYAYAVCSDWDMAIKNYLTALKYDREDSELYANLGEAYEKKGLYQEALKAYTNAYELNPESAKAAPKIPKLKILLLQKKAQKKTRSDEE
jgi:tetratricopeptide (TPR) repeat protein